MLECGHTSGFLRVARLAPRLNSDGTYSSSSWYRSFLRCISSSFSRSFSRRLRSFSRRLRSRSRSSSSSRNRSASSSSRRRFSRFSSFFLRSILNRKNHLGFHQGLSNCAAIEANSLKPRLTLQIRFRQRRPSSQPSHLPQSCVRKQPLQSPQNVPLG